MESKKISEEEKEKLREMLRETSYEKLEDVGRKSDEEHAGFLLGGLLGRRGFAIFLLLWGGVAILLGVRNLALLGTLSRSMPIPPLAWGLVSFSVVSGMGLLAVGILNLTSPLYKVLLLNGVFMVVLGILQLVNFLLGKSIIPFLYSIIALALGIYFIRWHVQRTKWLRSRGKE
jgi:hypothetical protein